MQWRRWNRIGRLADDERATAAVEFALILPFLLLLFLGTMEASALITVDRRVNVISGTVGDLVARTDPTEPLSVTLLNDFFQASQGIIFPYNAGDLRQVVSIIEVAADGTATVEWSCGYNGGVKHTAGASFTLPANMNLLARPPAGNGFVVASESWYSYLPLLGLVYTDEIDLYRTSFYLPRYDGEIASPGAC
jgi:Flp pilus assembly protein TadG